MQETIRVKFLGHIKTSMGAEEVEVPLPSSSVASGQGMRLSELFEVLLAKVDLAKTGPAGFNRYNTLVVVNDGEVFSASAEDRLLGDGDSVLLVPFSHGG